jgi:opacity protein-like surface antigen
MFAAIFFLALLFQGFPVCAGEAREWSRAGRWEGFIFGQDMSGDTAEENIAGVPAVFEVDDFAVFGIGAGYHFNDHLAVKLDLFAGSTDLKVESGLLFLDEDTDLSGMDLNIDAFFFKGRFTPFVTAGIGFLSFYEDLDDDDCYCYDNYDDYSTEFSYNVGAGIRWNFTDHIFATALYRSTWSELEDTDETFQFDGFSLTGGYLF